MKNTLISGLLLISSLCSFGRSPLDSAVTFHGKIINAKTNQPVNATIEIFRNSDCIVKYEMKESHEFILPLRDYGMYMITVSAPGYVDATDTLWILSEKRKNINRQFNIVPVEVGLTVTLRNIYFESARARLSDESYSELDKMTRFFRENPGVIFEIGGHTDHSGSAENNLALSKARAQSVVRYLVNHGVNSAQLIARGYGSTKPLDNNLTLEAEARNRRVEFTVLNVVAGTGR